MDDEQDDPIMTVEISSRDRGYLLVALWNQHCTNMQTHDQFLGKDGFDQIELDTMLMFERTFDLVRKLGGDPERPNFGLVDWNPPGVT